MIFYILFKVLNGQLSPLLFNGTWVSDNQICYQDFMGGISLLDVSDPNITSYTIMPKEIFVSIIIHKKYFSNFRY